MITVGIIGGAGYTAGELIRLLLHHPEVELVAAQSNSQAGKKVSELHRDLEGDTELVFSKGIDKSVDAVFLCMGHGKSEELFQKESFGEDTIVIDLSADYRHNGRDGFIYGLPELNRNQILKSNRIANPGCFATCIQLGLLPLAKAGLLMDEVHIHAITGSTGAGVGLSETSHFSWRNDNISIYKPFTHQHLDEINESLNKISDGKVGNLNFLPVRGNFTRGIFASMYTQYKGSLDTAVSDYKEFYKSHPFVTIIDKNPSLKQVVNTNKCLIYLAKQDDKLLVISMIDNLLKGASGQAIQNLNIVKGWDEKLGLELKAAAF